MSYHNLSLQGIFTLFILMPLCLLGQQINIPRIDQMPDFPQPYEMRDWKSVARQYDSTVFDVNLQGQYLPLVFFRESSVNYPGQLSFGLHTTVGTTSPASGEAINAIPALVGATLNGIDKSDQFGHNWAQMAQEFFNKRPSENVYLNHPAASSGHDWWYETMPNVFYMQLRALYPEVTVFDDQLETMAMQWYQAVEAMGGSAAPWSIPYMNYRAWKFSTMQPLETGVPEPEAAGAIAWILYQTYVNTGKEHYRHAAEMALDYMDGLQNNPSYELQLAYGAYTAARMNAETGTSYDLDKMLNWLFNRGPLRGWGSITGNWGGYDCSGLIGEANDQGNDYAFMMNGYQHAAALVPLVRYDERYATAIAKWVLNLANASRLFYPASLPANQQDNYAWSQLHDPLSVIGYEALKETKHNKSPYATGDGVDGGWSATNLMLYNSSHVGYLAALIEKTNVEGILQLDLLKTDFYHQEAYPTYLYYNPFDEEQAVVCQLPAGAYNIYNVLTNTVETFAAIDQTILQIPAKTVKYIVLIPTGAIITQDGIKNLANGIIIDFNNGQTAPIYPRIMALVAGDSIVEWNVLTKVFCTVDGEGSLTYNWWIDDEVVEANAVLDFSSNETGEYTIACKVTNEEMLTDSAAIVVKVVEKIPLAPVFEKLKAIPRKAAPGQEIQVIGVGYDANGDSLTYLWTDHENQIIGMDSLIGYLCPPQAGDYLVFCTITDTDGLSTRDSLKLMIRESIYVTPRRPVATYLLDGNANDTGPDALHGSNNAAVSWTENALGETNKAAFFNGSNGAITLPASPLLNFTDAMSLSLHLKTEGQSQSEQFLVSHGSWQNRYKISLSDNRLRFTVNTTNGIVDLDSETTPEPGKWYHLAVVYNGQDAELWLNGELDAFKAHTGAINNSPVAMVFGQQLPGSPSFNYHGSLDNIRIFDYALSPDSIQTAQYLNTETLTSSISEMLSVHPNPSKGNSLTVRMQPICLQSMVYRIIQSDGRVITSGIIEYQHHSEFTLTLPKELSAGLYILVLECNSQANHIRFVIAP
jgi:hypothetical protein